MDTNDLPLTCTQYCTAYLLSNFLGIEVGMCPVRRQRSQWEGYNESVPDCSPLVSSVSARELGEGPSSKDERVIGMMLCVNHQMMVKHQTCIIHSWREWVRVRGMYLVYICVSI